MAKCSYLPQGMEPAVRLSGASDLWTLTCTALATGRTPNVAELAFVRHPSRGRGRHHRSRMETDWEFDQLQDQVLTLSREVRELRSRLREVHSASPIVMESMDLPDYPDAEVSAVADQVLAYLDEHGKTDVFDFAEAKEMDFRLVAQAFRRLEKRGLVTGD